MRQRIFSLIARGLGALAMALTLYGVYVARTTPIVFDQVFLGTMALTCAVAGVGLFLRRLIAFATVAVAAILALHLFELGHGSRTIVSSHDPQLVGLIRQMTRERPGQFTFQFPPASQMTFGGHLLLPDGTKAYALGGVSNKTTIMCREGPRNYAVFESDRFGMNNPATVYDALPAEVLFVGDSFTFGACVDKAYAFVNKIRETYPRSVNLGAGSNGPLTELATIREYGRFFSPKIVLWVYDENNDLYTYNESIDSDFENELANPILSAYLADPSFSQRLMERQADIDAVIQQGQDSWLAGYVARASLFRRFFESLSAPGVRQLIRGRLARSSAASQTPSLISDQGPEQTARRFVDRYEALLPKFIDTLRVARAETDAIGARLVFVHLPAIGPVCRGTQYPMRDRVIEEVARLGLPIVDLDKPLRDFAIAYSPGVAFSEWHCGGHFSEAGYEVIHRVLRDYLKSTELEWRGAAGDRADNSSPP